MKKRFVLGAIVLVGTFSGAMAQQYTRQQQEAACSDDAMRLCGDFVPDEARVTACMVQKRTALSPRCLVVFDAGVSRAR